MKPGGLKAARNTHELCAEPKHPLARFAFEADAQEVSGLFAEATEAIIEQGCITLRKETGMASAQRLRVPISSYRGVTLANGTQPVITLLHEVPDFCVTLAVLDPLHDNDETFASQGVHWAEALGCQFLTSSQDHLTEDELSAPTAQRPRARRSNSFFAERRPKFLAKRDVRSMAQQMPIRGAREIIARN